jgi:hypothetical protein
MKYRIKLFEAFSKKQIDNILNNYESIKNEPFSKQLQDILLVDKDLFQKIISAPKINTVLPKKDFIKILSSMQTTIPLTHRLKFMLLALETGFYKSLPASYSYHSIDKEIPDHYILRINGNDSMRFKPENNKIYIRDIKSHSDRGY